MRSGGAPVVPAFFSFLPAAVALGVVAALLAAGPLAQPADYHRFADRSILFGIPHAADVLSNIGFTLAGLWGWSGLRRRSGALAGDAGFGYRLFLLGLIVTGPASAWYHLAPDDARLAWDRLAVSLACAGLLAGVRAETAGTRFPRSETVGLAAFAVAGVLWWWLDNDGGDGDLRPYLLLQILPLLLIPLWQTLHRRPATERIVFAAALGLYVLAKLAELFDHELLAATAAVSGHTLKHLLATLAALLIVGVLRRRPAAQAAAVRQ